MYRPVGNYLVVSQVMDTGPIAEHNNRDPLDKVEVGDLIVMVNGTHGVAKEMLPRLRDARLVLSIKRGPPSGFPVRINKTLSRYPLGNPMLTNYRVVQEETIELRPNDFPEPVDNIFARHGCSKLGEIRTSCSNCCGRSQASMRRGGRPGPLPPHLYSPPNKAKHDESVCDEFESLENFIKTAPLNPDIADARFDRRRSPPYNLKMWV